MGRKINKDKKIQIGRQMDRQIKRYKKNNRQMGRQINRYKKRQINRQMGRQINRYKKDKLKDRWVER